MFRKENAIVKLPLGMRYDYDREGKKYYYTYCEKCGKPMPVDAIRCPFCLAKGGLKTEEKEDHNLRLLQDYDQRLVER